MIRFGSKDFKGQESEGSGEEEPPPQPMTPRTPELSEDANKENSLANQQKLFEDIHEKLFNDTVEENCQISLT